MHNAIYYSYPHLVLFISSCIIGLEKLLLQVIAVKFHQTTYQDRIAQSKYQIAVLSKLLAVAKKRVRRPSVDALVTSRGFGNQGKGGIVKIFKTTKNAIEKTTSVLGHMASEITGQKVRIDATIRYSSNPRQSSTGDVL